VVLGKVWAVHDVSVYLTDLVHVPSTDAMEIAEHLEFVTQSCAEAALDDQPTYHELTHREVFHSIENKIPSKLTINQSKGGNDGVIKGKASNDWRPFGRELDMCNTKAPRSLMSNEDPLIGSSKTTMTGYGSTGKGGGLEQTCLDCDRENFNRLVM